MVGRLAIRTKAKNRRQHDASGTWGTGSRLAGAQRSHRLWSVVEAGEGNLPPAGSACPEACGCCRLIGTIWRRAQSGDFQVAFGQRRSIKGGHSFRHGRIAANPLNTQYWVGSTGREKEAARSGRTTEVSRARAGLPMDPRDADPGPPEKGSRRCRCTKVLIAFAGGRPIASHPFSITPAFRSGATGGTKR